jgi:hypothetical protein
MNIKRLLILTGTVLLGLTLVSMWLLFLSGPPESARAAGPWYVAPGGNDSESCLSTAAPCATINGAIGKASGGDTIFVATGTYTDTGNEVVLIDRDITLSGGWDASFTTQSGTSTIDGEDTRRGVYIAEGVTTIIESFTIQNGYYINEGGGLDIEGTLTMTNSTVNNNTSDEFGGGISVVGPGMLFLESSIVSSNSTIGPGGGIGVTWGGYLNMSGSWVVGNAAGEPGGGIDFDPGEAGESAYIENSIIAGNISQHRGGGLHLGPGGPFQIVNTHIVGNVASTYGGALEAWGPVQVELTNTLIISNTGLTGIDDWHGGGTVYLLNYCDTYGNSPDGGVSITRSNCLGTPPEDGLDPMMAGGALPSGVGPDYAAEWLSYDYRLLPGSPAIDAGTPMDAPATDIEGNPRDATPDLGAYEVANAPPSIIGVQSGQTVDDNATIDPFTSVTISDLDDDTLTVIISLDNVAKGELTNLGGFVKSPTGTYTYEGSPTFATTAIRGLTFNPTPNRRPPSNTDTTTFTISADDGFASPVTDETTTVIATSINDPPTISGTVAGQTVDDNATIDPFSAATISDPDKNATLTVTVSLDDPDKGDLTNLGGFVEGPDGTYTFAGSPAASTTAIQGLTFVPTEGRVSAGEKETTTFTISANDSFADPVTDDTTTVIVTAVEKTKTLFLPLVTRNFCSDFFDDFSDPSSGWGVGEDEDVRTEYLDGEYRILTKDDTYIYFYPAPTCDRENYVLEVDARWVGTPGLSYGLIFGMTGRTPAEMYIFDLNTDFGDYALYRFDDGYEIVSPTVSPAINGGTASNHLKVTRNGNQITLEVNDVVLGTWVDGKFTGLTGVGIIANPYLGEPISDVRYDNFSVSSLPGSSTP